MTMDTSNESIFNALMVLQKVCTEREDCNGCPLRDSYETGCELRKAPANWKLNAPGGAWRAFKG